MDRPAARPPRGEKMALSGFVSVRQRVRGAQASWPASTHAGSSVRAIALLALALASSAPAQDPLPSWNDGPVRKSLMEFVARVTKAGGPDFVPPAERIATFDNDGTLWCEQP